ncbi:MAG: biotin/lipoyl-binding protein [Gemmatimonadota bacterium]
MIYHVTVGGRAFEVDMSPEGVRVDGKPVDASLHRAGGSPLWALHVDHATYPVVSSRKAKGMWSLRLRGVPIEAEVIDERTRVIREMAGVGAGAAGPSPVVASMPGLVLRVEVSEGDEVTEGQGIAIVEAMKMENELRAAAAGVVSKVLVREGEAVEKDQVLVEFAAPDGEG